MQFKGHQQTNERSVYIYITLHLRDEYSLMEFSNVFKAFSNVELIVMYYIYAMLLDSQLMFTFNSKILRRHKEIEGK